MKWIEEIIPVPEGQQSAAVDVQEMVTSSAISEVAGREFVNAVLFFESSLKMYLLY